MSKCLAHQKYDIDISIGRGMILKANIAVWPLNEKDSASKCRLGLVYPNHWHVLRRLMGTPKGSLIPQNLGSEAQ